MSSCPVCISNDLQELYPRYTGTCVTSDMKILDGATIDNRICRTCGLIFNAQGTRNFVGDFYRDSYELMIRNEGAAIQSFSGLAPVSQAQRTYDILAELINLQETGGVLEAGAGKGEFLSIFASHHPNWSIFAFEPSSSYATLKTTLTNATLAHCDYDTFDFMPEGADLVVALGVLEHVENPKDMLAWAYSCLKPGGYFYIRVPNFRSNPNDLFCVDHLSKLTIDTVKNLASATGFDFIDVRESGVPVFFCLRKATTRSDPLISAYDANLAIVEQNESISKAIMDSILDAYKSAAARKEKFAIFGLASAGLFAPFFGSFEASAITAYVDENKTLWGSTVNGRPVVGPEEIPALGIKHVALSISPIYFDQVRRKLEPYGVTIYAGK